MFLKDLLINSAFWLKEKNEVIQDANFERCLTLRLDFQTEKRCFKFLVQYFPPAINFLVCTWYNAKLYLTLLWTGTRSFCLDLFHVSDST